MQRTMDIPNVTIDDIFLFPWHLMSKYSAITNTSHC